MNAQKLGELVSYVFKAHAESPVKPSKAFRKWDGKTPYGVHPTWCAMMILAEPALPESLRQTGAEVLLLHDILEDTTVQLPHDCSPEVVRLVGEMTFPGGSEEEMRLVWERSSETKLFKLYDKVFNFFDSLWMTVEKRERYAAHMLRLADFVASHYGDLNIVRIARAICT